MSASSAHGNTTGAGSVVERPSLIALPGAASRTGGPTVDSSVRVVEIINLSSSANTLLKNRVLAMRARGIDCRIICIDGPHVPLLREQGIPVHTAHLPRGRNLPRALQSMIEIMAYLHRERIDLVHTHCSVPGFVGRLAGRLAGVPVVMHTVHGFPFHEHSSPLQRAVYLRLERFAGWFTDMLLSQNRSDLEEARREHIVPGERLRYIGNGIDLEAFRPQPRVASHEAPFTVTCVARLEPVKNHRMLFEAAKIMKQNGRHFRIWLVGDGPLRAEYERQCASMGIADVVEFLGYRGDMPAMLAQSDVAVLPSIKEGIPRAVLEPMGMALPVVGTRVVGTREAVRDGETGYLVELGDAGAMAEAIGKLQDDEELRRRLGRRGREVALAEFNERTIIGTLISIYRTLLSDEGIEVKWPTAVSIPS